MNDSQEEVSDVVHNFVWKQNILNGVVDHIFHKWDEYFNHDRSGINGSIAINERQVAYHFSFNFKLTQGAELTFMHTIRQVLSETDLLFSFNLVPDMRMSLMIYSDPSVN